MNNMIFLWQNTGAAPAEGNPMVTILFMVVGLGIFYFFFIRPQAKEQKEANNFVSTLKKGTKIVTSGGMHGTIVELTEESASLLIAPKTIITIQKSSISLGLTKSVYGKKEATAAG
jgi:preprotein translocase subunit YajC